MFVFCGWTLAAAGTVPLGWDAITDPDIAGYRIYQMDPGTTFRKVAEIPHPANTATVDVMPEDGRVVTFVATAYDSSGNESGYSNAVQWTVPDHVAPGIPQNFRITLQMSGTISIAPIE